MTDISVPDEMIGWSIKRLDYGVVITQGKFIKRLHEIYLAFIVKTKSPSTAGALLHLVTEGRKEQAQKNTDH
jgi:hypothetical protein